MQALEISHCEQLFAGVGDGVGVGVGVPPQEEPQDVEQFPGATQVLVQTGPEQLKH